MRKVDTVQYITMLRELTEHGHEVSLRISGSSMTPFLVHERDSIYFRKPDRPLKRGDMVFYQRSSGQYVMHRICRVDDTGIYTVGDAQMDIEGPLAPEQIFGLITGAKRKGRRIGPGDFWWEFFENVWIRMIPLRGVVRRAYEKGRGNG